MVETRASRRAAEEDSYTSSQPVRPASRAKAGSKGSASAQTSKTRSRSQVRDEDSLPSAQTPSKKKARVRSKARSQTPAQTPRTRLRARREAEESIASSEVRGSTTHPHPAEEDSNNTPPKSVIKKAVSTTSNRTSVSNTASTLAPASQTNRSRPNACPPTPAQTPRTRLRARREAEESIASSEVRVTAPCIQPAEENSSNSQRKTTAKKSASVGQRRSSKNSDAPTPSRRKSLVARRTRTFGAKSTVLGNEGGSMPDLSLGSNAERTQSQGMEKSVAYDARPHTSDTPNPRKRRSSLRTQLKDDSLTEKGDAVPTDQSIRHGDSNDFDENEQSAEQRIQTTKRVQRKPLRPTLKQQVTSKTVSSEEQPLIAEFISTKPLSTDPEVNALYQVSTTQDRNRETWRPPSKHSVQAELSEVVVRDDVQTTEHVTPLSIPLPSTDFDGFDPDHVHAIPVEDDEPPPPPGVLQSSVGSIGITLRNTQKSTQELQMGENDKQKKGSRALPADEESNERDPIGTAGKSAPTVIADLATEENLKGNAPVECEVVPRGDVLEMRRKAEANKAPHASDSKRIAERKGSLSVAETRPQDILDENEIRVMKEHEHEKEESNALDSLLSRDGLRREGEIDPRSIVNEDNAVKVSSVEGILSMDEKNMSVFFRRNLQTSRTCRKLLSQYYAEQTKFEYGSDARYQFIPKRRKDLPPMGPLAQIEVGDHFDNDQLWEELELRNKPLLAYLHREVKAIEKQNKDAERAIRRVTMNDGDSGSEQAEPDTNPVEEVSKGELSKAEESAGENDLPKANMLKETREDKGHRRTVRFAEILPASQSTEHKEESELGDKNGGKCAKAKKKRPRLEDGFFNIADMDHFADEAEELALSGKLMASDDEQGSEKLSDESDGETEELDMEAMEDSLGRYLYSDFFDPPSKDSGKGAVKALGLIDEDELSDSDGVEEDPDSKNGTTHETVRESDTIAEDSAELTPLQRMRARSKKRIHVLEEASVAKKSWELRGEVSAFARPKDSLLDTEMQHDIAVKPKTFLSSAINESIEEVIKQRIVDGLFDDVVMRLPEEYVANKSKKSRQELPEISQEKPTDGLAELYAKEFTEEREKKNREILSSKAVQKELDEPLGEEQKEVNRLFEKLSKKLDALSSLHYTPIPDDTNVDVTVKTNVKAIASEEAIPEGVSSATLLAPNEVYSVDKKDLVGEKELDKDKRRAARRGRKSKRRKTREADESRKDAVMQADPALAEKRRAEAALIRRGKKPKLAEHDLKLAAQSSSKNLMKRFGVVTNPGMETPQRKTPASHFRL